MAAGLAEFGDGEVGLAVGGGDDLGAGLGGGIGVVTAERIGLAVAPDPLLVLVALVGGDGDDGADGGGAADGVEDAGGADDVGLVGADGVVVGEADERLGSEMEDDFGGEVVERGLQSDSVADVAANVSNIAADAGDSEEVGVSAGVERVAADDGAFGGQPQGEPSALEAGVTGEEDFSALPGEGFGRHGIRITA